MAAWDFVRCFIEQRTPDQDLGECGSMCVCVLGAIHFVVGLNGNQRDSRVLVLTRTCIVGET